MEPLLSIENLSVDIYRGKTAFRAVDTISFDLFKGEICGLVGESGCGKSLTALSIAGLLPDAARASGRVVLEDPGGAKGRNILTMNENELCEIRGNELSMIFQEPISSLNPLMKIGRQIMEVLEIHGEKKNAGENRLKALGIMRSLNLTDSESIIDNYPWQLPGGMCQRVMIALAMIRGPRLLIADEPTTALDLGTQDQIISLLKTINRKSGTTIFFISHDLNVIRQLCGRVMVMYAGKIMEEGNTEDVFLHPAHEYTRSLIGALPENNKKGERLKVIPGKVPAIEEKRMPGCPFFPRCEKAEVICGREFPEEVIINERHRGRCIKAIGQEQI